MNACEMFYAPSKSILQIILMLKTLANAVANLTNELRIKREHKAWITNLDNTHCGCFSLSNICQALFN